MYADDVLVADSRAELQAVGCGRGICVNVEDKV